MNIKEKLLVILISVFLIVLLGTLVGVIIYDIKTLGFDEWWARINALGEM